MPIAKSSTQFAFLADTRLREAGALVAKRHWLGALYLAGYAVECSLKAKIAKNSRDALPDSCKTHDLVALRKVLAPTLTDEQYVTLRAVPEWSHLLRYECRAPSARTVTDFINQSKEAIRCLQT